MPLAQGQCRDAQKLMALTDKRLVAFSASFDIFTF
jgi:hypothetical protein